jgi:hypothetical protein
MDPTTSWKTDITKELQDNPRLNRVIEIIENEIEAIKQDNFESVSSVSALSKSSRKRKRATSWSEILQDIDVKFENEYIDPCSFSEMNNVQVDTFLRQRGALDHKKAILEKLQEALTGPLLPSPSNMTWDNALRILDGPVSDSDTKIMECLPEVDDIGELPDIIKELDVTFRNVSETDACIRVIFVLYYTFKSIEGVKIEAQPTVHGHATSTDFLIRLVKDNQVMCLIEVKKADVYTALTLESSNTAQVIREAHIMLRKCSRDISVILTNGLIWSFGLVKKTENNKINIFSTKTMNFSLEVSQILRKLISL